MMPAIDDAAIVVSAASRALRRKLRPLAWVVLEEVALDAVVEDGRLVARTSARQVAERLGIDPTTANKALSALRGHGLLTFEREEGPAGRFGLSVYVLWSITGLTVVSPCVKEPCVAPPCLETPTVVDSDPASADASGPHAGTAGAVKRRAVGPHMVGSGAATAGNQRTARATAPAASATSAGSQCDGQTVLDLGMVSS